MSRHRRLFTKPWPRPEIKRRVVIQKPNYTAFQQGLLWPQRLLSAQKGVIEGAAPWAFPYSPIALNPKARNPKAFFADERQK